MKLFLALLFITTNAFAINICKFEETSDFKDELEERGIRPARVSKNHKKFTSVEKQLIHRTVTLQSWLKNSTMKEALESFGDYYEGQQGSNAGEIEYYNIEGKQYILVHYWPGDNEYGAYYAINKNGSFKLVAEINDSFIECK